jgi:hypothetical protein
MKKIALISTFCDTLEKKDILRENIIKIKNLGIDVMAVSPIEIPQDIVNLCDFFFFTKENPLLGWPERGHTQWYRMPIPGNKFTEIHRAFNDYGWAGLYQVKKLSQIALTFDYDVFYHVIYDLNIDEIIESELKGDEVNLVHPRLDPNSSDHKYRSTLHFMIFDRSLMGKIVNEIDLETYLRTNGIAEDEVEKWVDKFQIKRSDHLISDKIFYWENVDFFNYSPFDEFKIFLSKNEKTSCLLGADPNKYRSELTDNLRIIFHSFDQMDPIKIEINGIEFIENPRSWEFIEFPISSQSIDRIVFEYAGKSVDFTDQYNKISMNQIYYN